MIYYIIGWSDSGEYPRTAEIEVKELHEILYKKNEKGPFLLVVTIYSNNFSLLKFLW